MLQVLRLSLLICLVGQVISLPSANPGIAIPLHKRNGYAKRADGKANIAQLKAQLKNAQAKYARSFAAFEKNTGKAHPLASGERKASFDRINKRDPLPVLPLIEIEKRQTPVSEPMTDDQDELWFGTIDVGTPPQTFTVDFDTGSSDTFLPAVGCDASCDGHTLYNTAASSTAINTTEAYTLAFGDGSSTVSGFVFHDTVTIAGLTATNQGVGASDTYSASFEIENFSPDGLVGLAFPALAVFTEAPLFTTLVNEGVVLPQFGMKLAETGSELFLGGVNPALFTGAFTTYSLVQDAFYEIILEGLNVNNNLVATGEIAAIVDSGTTLLIGDPNGVAILYSQIPGAQSAANTIGEGFFTVPCDNVPTVGFNFNGDPTLLNVAPAIFNLGVLEGNECVGGVVFMDIDFWVMGDVFMRNFYTSFDQGASTVGFATLA